MFERLKRLCGRVCCRVGLHAWRELAVEDEAPGAAPGELLVIDANCARCGVQHPVYAALMYKWHMTESDGAASFTTPHAVTKAQAMKIFRDFYPTATLDYIDDEWHVIFYRFPKKRIS